MITSNNPYYDEWHKDEVNRLNLATLLRDPTFLKAVQVLRRNNQPEVTAVASANPTLAAAMYQAMAGANDVLDDLFELAKEPKQQSNTPMPKEWERRSRPDKIS